MKQPELVINEFDKGIGDSPFVGYGDIRNLDLTTEPGVVFPNFQTTLATASGGFTADDRITWIVRNTGSGSNFFAVDFDGKVWSSNNGTSWSGVAGYSTSSTNGGGLAIYKNYLFIFRNKLIDVYGPLSSSPSYTLGWKSIEGNPTAANNSDFHPALVGQDDILYIGCGHVIATVEEVVGETFDPGDSSTYTFNSEALDIPSQQKIKCLAELGKNLMIGTHGSSNQSDEYIANIYPWDRVSPSFDIPIQLQEIGVHQMLTVNNILYVVAGIEGSVYKINGVSTVLMRQLPRSVTSTLAGAELQFLPGAIAFHHNKIHFGVSSNSTGRYGLGVWSITLDGQLTYEYTISSGANNSATDDVYVSALLSIGTDTLLIGWDDRTTAGIDYVDTSSKYGSYAAYLETPVYEVGNSYNKRTFSQMHINLGSRLSSGTGIRVSYRTSSSDSYTTIGTYDYATLGNVNFISTTANITDAVQLQLKVELTSSSLNTTKLKSITLL